MTATVQLRPPDDRNSHDSGLVTLALEDGAEHQQLCFTGAELLLTPNFAAVQDLARLILLQRTSITWFRHTEVSLDGRNTLKAKAPAGILHCDTARLLNTLSLLLAKHDRFPKNQWGEIPPMPFAIEKFRIRIDESLNQPIPTAQAVAHPNARDDMARTLRYFHARLKPDYWKRLLCDLHRYLTCAIVFGHREEFYFDGRRLANGCCFNGGFILHGNEYGIHT